MSGRVTKKDIMSFIESGAAVRPQDLLRKDTPKTPQVPQTANPTLHKKPNIKHRKLLPLLATELNRCP